MLTAGLRFLPLRLGGFILPKLAFQMHLKTAVKTLGGKINKLEINKAEVNHVWHDFSLALMFLPVTAPERWLEILALSSVVTPMVGHRRQWLSTEEMKSLSLLIRSLLVRLQFVALVAPVGLYQIPVSIGKRASMF